MISAPKTQLRLGVDYLSNYVNYLFAYGEANVNFLPYFVLYPEGHPSAKNA